LSRIIICLLFIITPTLLFAQENDNWTATKEDQSENVLDSAPNSRRLFSPTDTGSIEIIQDERIKQLNALKKSNPTKLSGYRVQVFFGNREKARETRTDILRRYPDMPVYISYLAPNFRVRVGDFRKKLESEAFKHEIENQFPGCYIVKDKIELPELEKK
jgi:hypothetical protein